MARSSFRLARRTYNSRRPVLNKIDWNLKSWQQAKNFARETSTHTLGFLGRNQYIDLLYCFLPPRCKSSSHGLSM